MEKKDIPKPMDTNSEINSENVIHHSGHYKMLEGKESKKVKKEARKLVELGLIDYNKEKKCYLCESIPEKDPKDQTNKTYSLIWDKTKPKYKGEGFGDFECSCSYNQRKLKMCPHILALYLMLKIWNWERREAKKL